MVIFLIIVVLALLLLGVSFLAALPVYQRVGDAVHGKAGRSSHREPPAV